MKSILKHTAIGIGIASALTLMGLFVIGIALLILGHPF